MCTEAYCPSEQRDIETLNDLLRFVPAEFIVLVDGATAPGTTKEDYIRQFGDCCLCAVDMKASFVGIGKWSARQDDEGWGRWLIEPKPETM